MDVPKGHRQGAGRGLAPPDEAFYDSCNRKLVNLGKPTPSGRRALHMHSVDSVASVERKAPPPRLLRGLSLKSLWAFVYRWWTVAPNLRGVSHISQGPGSR